MQIRSISTFLLCALISATAVPAREIDAALIRQEKRQTNLGTGSSGSSTSVTTLPSPTSISSDTATSSSRGSIVTESSTIVTTPDVTSATTVISSTITRTSTDASGSVTTKAEVTSSTATSEITYSYSPVVTSATSQVTLTYTSIEGGRTVTGVRTSSTVVPFTSSARVTPTALASGSGNSNGGLSDSSKKIIGGVVGGIGGALLIGALAWTAWKVRSKKKNLHDDDLYDPNANTEKLNTTTNAQQPFRTTLDQYHNPGPVNPSSNF